MISKNSNVSRKGPSLEKETETLELFEVSHGSYQPLNFFTTLVTDLLE